MARFCELLAVALLLQTFAPAVHGAGECSSSDDECTSVANGRSLLQQSRHNSSAKEQWLLGNLLDKVMGTGTEKPTTDKKHGYAAPTVVFHVLGYDENEMPPWGKHETLNVFAPDQHEDFNASCDKDAKPLKWSRTWEPPGWWATQRQYLDSLHSLLSRHPHADYYMLVDSDTVVFPRNLHALVAYLEEEVLDDDDDLYMGHGLWFHPRNDDHMMPFIMSGGGVLLRGRTLRTLKSTGALHDCSARAKTDRCWHHLDWTLASCLSWIGVKPTGHVGFQQFVDECPKCCTHDSIACHPVKSKDEQVSMTESHFSRHGPVRPQRLTKHLAESCGGKHYAWTGPQGSACAEEGSRQFQIYSKGDENLCLEGKIVPELFLLGAQKAGTSSLAVQLVTIPGIIGRRLESEAPAHDRGVWKEAHFFDKHESSAETLESWLGGYPSCTNETRIVAMDATPNYLFSEFVPERIKQRYGVHSDRLKFAVILREPLARAQSAFYHYKADARWWGTPHAEVFSKSFRQYIEELIQSNATKHSLLQACDDPLFNSRYALQLERYFKTFRSRQFSIAPFRSLSSSGSFSLALAAKFRLPRLSDTLAHENRHVHPSLDEDLDPLLMSKAVNFVQMVAGVDDVARVLVASHGRNAELFGFGGDRTSADGIARWLAASW